MPLRIDNESIGVLCFEKVDGSFSHLEIISMRLIANQVIKILKHLYEVDMNIFKKIKYKAKKHLKWWLGVNHTFIKLISVGVFIFFVYSLLASWEYKVESTASLTTDSVSLVCAPYDGIVFDVLATSGDKVSKDDLLMKLDTKELFLKLTESNADITRFKAQAQKARADNKLADMNMANARVQQVSAELEKIKYYLKQADIKSPFDGIVVKGDKEELLGAPVSKGEKLFQIAQLSDFYLTIHVEESYIDEIEVGQHGELKLLSRPDEVIPFIVDKIIPMANVDSEQKNSFIVKAKFINESEVWWRSGMSGVAKVNIGEKSVYWILTHKFVNFLRMYFWI
jgi:multidrug resistance efflux pump